MTRHLLLVMLSAVAAFAAAQVFPTPKSLVSGPSPASRGTTLSTAAIDPAFKPVLRAFLDDWGFSQAGTGRKLTIKRNPNLKEEEYRLNYGAAVILEAASSVGVAWGLQTLGQMITGQARPANVRDWPDAPFRCLMVDVARRYHSISTLRMLVRWCSAAKVRFIQLHLTDDQNWMLPTEVLKGVDARNQHLLPAYTRAELANLQAFASARGVAIIPEIDIPGHSSLLTQLDPPLYRIQGSESSSCIDFPSDKVREKMTALLREVARLFPNSPYIHIGGDEAWYPNAEKDADFASALQKLGRKSTPGQVFVDFVSEMAEEVVRLGKTPLVWEGFSSSDFAKARIPKQTVVVAWEGHYYPASKLADDGFTVINAGWDPYYVVNHFPYEAFTLVPLERLYSSDPKRFGIVNWSNPKESSFLFSKPEMVEGSMMCWWEGHEWNAQKFLPSRVLAFGSGLWNAKGRPAYRAFLSQSAQVQKAVLGQGHPFSVDLVRERTLGTGQFTDSLSVRVKPKALDLMIAMRTDGKTPLAADLQAGQSLSVDRTCVVAIQAFREGRPVGETRLIPVFKVTVVHNLALGWSVSTSGESDPQFPASYLTDGVGDQLSAYWLSYPNPQTATIDLARVREIDRVQVVAFWASGAPARYRIETSKDGALWESVVDASKQTAPPKPEGYEHRFARRSARFIRLEALGGDLFPPTMSRINEVRAFLGE